MKVPSEIFIDPDQQFDNLNALPPTGRTYTVTLSDPTNGLGIIFYRASQLTSCLISPRDTELAETLGDRPVASHCFNGSACAAAGVQPGHVLIKVGDEEVEDPEAVVRAVRSADVRQPLICEVYEPDWTDVVNAFEEYAVVDVGAGEMQEAYVVVGGILGKRGEELQIYKSKADYDQAIFDSKDGLEASVKKGVFSLQGAQVQIHCNDTASYILLKLSTGSFVKIANSSQNQLDSLLKGIRHNILLRKEEQHQKALQAHSIKPRRMTKKFLKMCKKTISRAA